MNIKDFLHKETTTQQAKTCSTGVATTINGSQGRMGWICPICGAGVAPHESVCPLCHGNHSKMDIQDFDPFIYKEDTIPYPNIAPIIGDFPPYTYINCTSVNETNVKGILNSEGNAGWYNGSMSGS